jgi:hypothetical protein
MVEVVSTRTFFLYWLESIFNDLDEYRYYLHY